MVLADYAEFIRMDPSVPNELRDSLRVHERTPIFIERIVGQIKEIERLKPHIKLDRMKIKKLVYDMTQLYIALVKKQVDEMRMSDLAKEQYKKDVEGPKDLQKFDKDGNADFTEEYGFVITDKKVH